MLAGSKMKCDSNNMNYNNLVWGDACDDKNTV